MKEFVEKIFGEFEEKKFRNKTIIGIIGAIAMTFFDNSQNSLLLTEPTEVLLHVFFFFCVSVGIVYGINIILGIFANGGKQDISGLAWLTLIVLAFVLGIVIGGILYIVDFIRWVVFKMARRK